MPATEAQREILDTLWIVSPTTEAPLGSVFDLDVAPDAYTQIPLPLFGALPFEVESANTRQVTPDISLPEHFKAPEGQLPLFVRSLAGNSFSETPISHPLALKSVRDNPYTVDAVRQWAARTYWSAYGAQVRGLEESSRLGTMAPEEFPDRLQAVDNAFGLPRRTIELDGRVDIGTSGITDVRARIALANQEDAARRAQLVKWKAGYVTGAPGNQEFTLENAGVNRNAIENAEGKQNARIAESDIREDVLYLSRVSNQGQPPMYAYQGKIDLVHGPEAIKEVFTQPERDARAALPKSAQLAQAGMPYLATVYRVEELGDEIAANLPSWTKPVVKGTARVVGIGVGAALAAACGGGVIGSGEGTPIPPTASPMPTEVGVGTPMELSALYPAGPFFHDELVAAHITEDLLVHPSELAILEANGSMPIVEAQIEMTIKALGQASPSMRDALDYARFDVADDGTPVTYLEDGKENAFVAIPSGDFLPVDILESGNPVADADRIGTLVTSSMEAQGIDTGNMDVVVDPGSGLDPRIAAEDVSSIFVQQSDSGQLEFGLPSGDPWQEFFKPMGVQGVINFIVNGSDTQLAIVDPESHEEQAILGSDFQWRDQQGRVLPVTATPPPAFTPTEVLPSAIPESTSTPKPVETYFSHDTVNGVKIQELLDTNGIRITDSDIDFPGLIDPVKNPNGIVHVQELDRNLLVALSPFIQADGTLNLPIDEATFTWRFRWDEDSKLMIPELFFADQDGNAIMLSDDGRSLIQAELVNGVLVPTLKDGRVIKVTPEFVPVPTLQPGQQLEATAVPPAQGTEAPPVVAPTAQPPAVEQPPAVGLPTTPVTGEWFFDTRENRNKWVCQGCLFDTELAKKAKQVALQAWDYGAQQWDAEFPPDKTQGLTPDELMSLITTLEGKGYQRRFMTMTSFDDPRDGVDSISLAVYVMHKNNPNP